MPTDVYVPLMGALVMFVGGTALLASGVRYRDQPGARSDLLLGRGLLSGSVVVLLAMLVWQAIFRAA